jgi:hypothetical protein
LIALSGFSEGPAPLGLFSLVEDALKCRMTLINRFLPNSASHGQGKRSLAGRDSVARLRKAAKRCAIR